MKKTFSKTTDIFSRYCNVTPQYVDIPENYFPHPFEDQPYFCVATEGSPAMRYDYFNEAVEEIIEKTGLRCIHIGKNSEQPLSNAIPLFTQDMTHYAFILKNSAGLLTNDNYLFHFAKVLGVSHLVVFGPSSYKCSYEKEFCHDKNNIFSGIFIEPSSLGIEPERKLFPSYSAQENPKTINTIHPEKVVNKFLQSIHKDYHGNNLSNKETKFIGKYFHHKVYEIIPDHVSPLNYNQNYIFVIRNDLLNNPELLHYNLSRPCLVGTKEPIALKTLQEKKQSIVQVVYNITDNEPNLDFVRAMEFLGIDYKFFMEDESKIDQARINLMDFKGIVHKREKETLDINIDKDYILQTNRVLMAQGDDKLNVYLNERDYLDKVETDSKARRISGKELQDEIFLQDLQHYWIYEVK